MVNDRYILTSPQASHGPNRKPPAMTGHHAISANDDGERLVESASRTIGIEREGLAALAAAVEGDMRPAFLAALSVLAKAKGRVIVSGMGKSGHVARKIAATLASTGTPASYVHPSEASHGDLGMITARDVIVALSWSGETAELASVIEYAQRFGVPMIAITSRAESNLGRAAEPCLILPDVPEACPHGLAPTTSTAMQLALGDALALSLLEMRGFTASDFRAFHPGGSLGARLTHVRDLMQPQERLPLVGGDTPMTDALVVMTEKSFGCLGIVDAAGHLAGVITDGDLRRHMGRDLLDRRAGDIMTVSPKSVAPDTLSAKALEIINASAITSLFVVEEGKPVGLVHIHDLLRAGVV